MALMAIYCPLMPFIAITVALAWAEWRNLYRMNWDAVWTWIALHGPQTRAGRILWWQLITMIRFGYHGRPRLKNVPRPGYCCAPWCGGMWTWLTNETPAYSAHDGCYICEDCAAENDLETEAAWASYYSGCL
jgi:hypothetical protein